MERFHNSIFISFQWGYVGLFLNLTISSTSKQANKQAIQPEKGTENTFWSKLEAAFVYERIAAQPRNVNKACGPGVQFAVRWDSSESIEKWMNESQRAWLLFSLSRVPEWRSISSASNVPYAKCESMNDWLAERRRNGWRSASIHDNLSSINPNNELLFRGKCNCLLVSCGGPTMKSSAFNLQFLFARFAHSIPIAVVCRTKDAL